MVACVLISVAFDGPRNLFRMFTFNGPLEICSESSLFSKRFCSFNKTEQIYKTHFVQQWTINVQYNGCLSVAFDGPRNLFRMFTEV